MRYGVYLGGPPRVEKPTARISKHFLLLVKEEDGMGLFLLMSTKSHTDLDVPFTLEALVADHDEEELTIAHKLLVNNTHIRVNRLFPMEVDSDSILCRVNTDWAQNNVIPNINI